MTIEFEEKLQERWNEVCRANGHIPRQGRETRYTEDGWMYNLLPGYGRVCFDAQLGWVAVLAAQGWNEDIFRYVKLDEALVADPFASTTEARP